MDDEPIEEGDQIFATCFHNEPAEVRATQNISQQPAEVFHKNLETKSFRDLALDYLHDFKDVFFKTSFDELPARKPWDHAIELIPDAQYKSCKVYPLSISEQEQLDKFLEENLMSGRICPSKSLMAAPFFFVKKNDGSLHPVQDYQALNAMTVKNKYPLPLISDLINQLHGAKYFTIQSAKWQELQDLLFFQDCIYVPKDADLHCWIVEQHHDSHIAGHAGQWKTLELVSTTTGGCKCPATLASIAKPVTSASRQKHRSDHQWVNSNRFQSQRDVGMWQV
jgi:hypothetical protein